MLPSETFDGQLTLEAVSQHRGTLLYGVPTMLLEVHSAYMKNKLPISLRGGAIGGSPCQPALMEKLINDLGMKEIACVSKKELRRLSC